MYISVQYLRAFAAFLVLLSHIGYKLSMNGSDLIDQNFHVGGYGVDLFFIISGFIMCVTLDKKKPSLVLFLRDRILRIIPLYWFLTSFALLIYLLKPSLVNSSGGDTSIFTSFTLIPNGDKYLINNGWTLSFEFLFYFIFALFIGVNLSVKKFTVAAILLLVFIGGTVDLDRPFLVFLFSPLLLEFAMGILSYLIIKRFLLSGLISILLIVLSCVMLSFVNHGWKFDGHFARVINGGLPMMFLFVGFVALESKIKMFTTPYEIGMSSYSMYLIHPFVLAGVTFFVKYFSIIHYNLLYGFLMFFMSFIIGWLCYFYVELNINKYVRNKFIR
ncbi:MAG: exopolysaccharide production protein ExoZ [Psychromonas sp.]|jgi:exopolysaccharide production protein ExoZ|uniref:acyltransferase family protein n=1 Tax=Psychromonas sp. TaxID=1884585 RepID=UPI0039E4B110